MAFRRHRLPECCGFARKLCSYFVRQLQFSPRASFPVSQRISSVGFSFPINPAIGSAGPRAQATTCAVAAALRRSSSPRTRLHRRVQRLPLGGFDDGNAAQSLQKCRTRQNSEHDKGQATGGDNKRQAIVKKWQYRKSAGNRQNPAILHIRRHLVAIEIKLIGTTADML